MTSANLILKSISKNFIKSFFIISFLFSGLFIASAQCDGNGVCIPGQTEAENNRTNELANTQTENANQERIKNAECNGTDNYNCYTLLEGFGGEDGRLNTITIEKDGLGKYLESIMTYFLMIVTIAAVFFMIYGGILYLTTDIVNKKAEGREVITRVVIGLIFVFSVWTIMNSINSGLLKNSLNFSLEGIGVAIKGAVTGSTPPSGSSTAPVGTGPGGTSTSSTPQTPPITISGSCSSGVVEVQNGIKLCSNVAQKMKDLLAFATKEGINLQLVSGFRDPQRQIELRRKNCGPSNYDIYQKPSRLCNPQTAIPGTSNHEKGVAVDFQNMSSKNANYDWLTKNAPAFGFYNDYAKTKEYWHWSTNGR